MPEVPGDPRSAFLLPRDVSYLNCAYMGPLPRTGVEAAWATADRKARPWTITTGDFFAPVEAYRASIAGLLGVDADGVAVTPSVSYGTSTFASLVPVAAGQVVLAPDDEFPSAALPFEAAARAQRGDLVRVAPEGRDRSGPLRAEIERRGDQVAVVSVPPCHWTDGTPFDLAGIAEATRSVGAALALDVTQWLGAAPLDVGPLAPDLVAGAVYKWLLGPYSLGFAWFAPRWRDGTPLEHSWIGRAGADDFAGLTTPSADYRPGARRFDVGESSQLSQLAVAQAGLDLVAEWDPAATAAHARGLTDRIAEGATAIGLGVAPPEQRAPHLLGLSLQGTGIEPARLASVLADHKVHVSVRGPSVRVAAHRFNTDDDVDRLLDALGVATRSTGA